ncbi:MAG: GNAT family N-acetyltransferase [Phycisphaerales bacterium]
MQRPSPTTLESDRVRLEPIGPEHAAGLFEIGQDERTFDYMISGPFLTLPAAEDEIAQMLADQAAGVRVPFAVIDRVGDGAGHGKRERFAGTTSWLDIRPEHGGIEIGSTWYGVPFRRSHVNSDTKRLLLAHAFETLGAHRVQLLTDERNEASRAAILRLGAAFEGILRRHKVYPNGFIRNSAIYAIVADEWPEIRERLDSR